MHMCAVRLVHLNPTKSDKAAIHVTLASLSSTCKNNTIYEKGLISGNSVHYTQYFPCNARLWKTETIPDIHVN